MTKTLAKTIGSFLNILNYNMNNQPRGDYLDREIPYLNANWKYPTMIKF